jgi:hypothetical protein
MHRFLTGREAGGTKPIFGLTAYVDRRNSVGGSFVMLYQGHNDSYGVCGLRSRTTVRRLRSCTADHERAPGVRPQVRHFIDQDPVLQSLTLICLQA